MRGFVRQNVPFSFETDALFGQRSRFREQPVHVQFLLLDGKGQFLVFRLVLRDRLGNGVVVLLGGVLCFGQFLDLVLQGLHVVKPKGNVSLLLLFVKRQILPGFFAFFLQRSDAAFQFSHDIPDADQIVLDREELFLRLFLLVPVFGNAGRLFEHGAALLALAGDDLRDLPLPDDGIAVPPDACIHEKLMDVLETDRLFVDEILGIACPVEPPGHGDFVIGSGQTDSVSGIRIVEGDGHLRESHLFPGFRSPEDDVLHPASAEILGGDLPEHPLHGVRDVGFSGPVGADDNRQTGVEGQFRLIREGFEPLHFQRF